MNYCRPRFGGCVAGVWQVQCRGVQTRKGEEAGAAVAEVVVVAVAAAEEGLVVVVVVVVEEVVGDNDGGILHGELRSSSKCMARYKFPHILTSKGTREP